MRFVQECHFQGERKSMVGIIDPAPKARSISACGIAPGLAAISLDSRQKIAGMTPYRSPFPFLSGDTPLTNTY